MRATGVQTFGNTLRAYRLGFRESERLGAFVRVATPVNGQVWICVCPLDQQVLKQVPKEHVCWWDAGDSFFDSVPPLKNVRCVKRPLSFFVDAETGELL